MPISNPSVSRNLVTGSYTGNDADDRQIPVGFHCSCVMIWERAARSAILFPSVNVKLSTGAELTGGSTLHGSDGFIVFKTTDDLNWNTDTYYYWAMGL